MQNHETWYARIGMALCMLIILIVLAYAVIHVYRATHNILTTNNVTTEPAPVGPQRTTFIGGDSSITLTYPPVWSTDIEHASSYLPANTQLPEGAVPLGGLSLDVAATHPGTNLSGAYIVLAHITTPAGDAGASCATLGNPGTPEAPETYNDVPYTVSTTGDAGAGHAARIRLYRTSFGTHCYEIALAIHTTSIANYEPDTITEVDMDAVERELRDVLASATFDR